MLKATAINENATFDVRRLLQLSVQEAQRFNHEYVSPEHILLGCVKVNSQNKDLTQVQAALVNLGADLQTIRTETEKLMQAGPEMVMIGKPPRTPASNSVLEHAIMLAVSLGQQEYDDLHVLLGLLGAEPQSNLIPLQVLSQFQITYEKVMEEAKKIWNHNKLQLQKRKFGACLNKLLWQLAINTDEQIEMAGKLKDSPEFLGAFLGVITSAKARPVKDDSMSPETILGEAFFDAWRVQTYNSRKNSIEQEIARLSSLDLSQNTSLADCLRNILK